MKVVEKNEKIFRNKDLQNKMIENTRQSDYTNKDEIKKSIN